MFVVVVVVFVFLQCVSAFGFASIHMCEALGMKACVSVSVTVCVFMCVTACV